ncbi:hypothetical protein [Rubrimonas cliftonensis]|uniref:DNA-3-methyladenine glycosylase II n=1 Tax=Rubrimonas cliftonensis TaxID=89524 RepID=A0A1H3XQM1_9RHOB|nr:hypothetical protein [Rubrimonas cliftonensis]SEA01191.1 DNA-3-methyladenine glycosylase II [Rubrimonas cliftonensis]
MTARIIACADDVAEGVAALRRLDRRFALAPSPPLRREPGGFAGLLRIVTGQQVSVAAARSIWTRLETAGATSEGGLAALDDEALRACGLSAPKIRTARGLVEAGVDYPSLAEVSEAEAMALLTALRGVGPWTAEIYLMFCVGRADVFAPGDLALQEAARRLFDLPGRPAAKALAALAQAWSPWRAVAARLLWAYYAVETGREGAPGETGREGAPGETGREGAPGGTGREGAPGAGTKGGARWRTD